MQAAKTAYGRRRGFSLLELLICVAIISVLSSISITCYYGAMDSMDINCVLPEIVRNLEHYRNYAEEESRVVRVEFIIGTPKYRVFVGSGENEELIAEENCKKKGVLKRRLTFRSYEWPDGGNTPSSFTFYPEAKPNGGIVHFGSAFADSKIMLKGRSVISDR